MERSWVPFSAMALVAGALALLFGTLLLPFGEEGAAATLAVVREQDQRLTTVAVMFCVAAVGLLMGIPSLLVLFPRRGRRFGLVAVGMMTVAGAGLAGFGMLLAFLRALAVERAVRPAVFEQATSEAAFRALLLAWVLSFVLFELLLGVAVLRARTAPMWLPLLLVLHAVLVPVGDLMPPEASRWLILLTAVGLSGLAVSANQEADRHAGIGPVVPTLGGVGRGRPAT